MSRADDERTLVLLRHAKTEQVPGKPDHDRELTQRGRLDAQAAGRWLRDNGIVADLVICSTSVRTRQTWDEAVRGGAHTGFVEYRRTVYDNSPQDLLETLRQDAGDVSTVVVVGHGPSVPYLASSLSDGQGSSDAHTALGDGFPTCGVAVLRYAGDWMDVDAGTATLERFHVCRA